MKKHLLIFLFLFFVQIVWAWDGSGTETDPYLIKNTADWERLAADVDISYSYSGKVFRMTADINTYGMSVGYSQEKPFAGTFDGDGHTLTFNSGEAGAPSDDVAAPFGYVNGATIRHLNVEGTICTTRQYAAGIVSSVTGTEPSKLQDCVSSVRLYGRNVDNAAFGGLVGVVAAGGLSIEHCQFSGCMDTNNSAGMVGWSNAPLTISYSMVSPAQPITTSGSRTFARMAGGVEAVLDHCYFTQGLENGSAPGQGELVFNKVSLPEGCTYEMESEPDVNFDGVSYWRNGAWVNITAADDIPFNHWTSAGNYFISDPLTKNGSHQLNDWDRAPSYTISTNPVPSPLKERTMDGTRYRYLSDTDFFYYISRQECASKGYYLEDGNSGYLVKNVNGTTCYITAVVGWERGDIPGDGAQIHNDLVGDWRDHTLLATIAPHAFEGCDELRTLYFKDTDANNYNAQAPFDFTIGAYAFANCPNLTEVKLMQYTTEGSNRWEALKPAQVTSVDKNVFYGSPQAMFSCDASEYQNFLASETWQAMQNRFFVYNHTDVDFTEYGAKYSEMRSTSGESLKNNAEGHAEIMKTLNSWSADYYKFVPRSLLAEQDKHNIWYTQIVGTDNAYLQQNNGALRIYNDAGDYYNYKTIAIGRDAFRDCMDLKSIEFWQTNGRGENSCSDLKMVIPDGAFRGCYNLKSLNLFYYVQDGDDHWETLGPEDVIPGPNIFGVPTVEEWERFYAGEAMRTDSIPSDFRIYVSPDRYQEFLEDPNWVPYLSYIEPVEFDPYKQNAQYTVDGITYDYITSPGGIRHTSQTVSQDVSWWTFPRLFYEVAADIMVAQAVMESGILQNVYQFLSLSVKKNKLNGLLNGLNSTASPYFSIKAFLREGAQYMSPEALGLNLNAEAITALTNHGLIENGVFVSSYGLIESSQMALDATILAKGVQTGIWNVIPQIHEARNFILNFAISKTISGSCFSALQSTLLANSTWDGVRSNDDALLKGMHNNIISNMHQVGFSSNGYLFFSPQKNLVYHTYVKAVDDNLTEAVIEAGTDKGQGANANTRTTTFAASAFRDHKNLKRVSFCGNNISTNEGVPMLLTIPDSAFVGCENLEEFSTLVNTKEHGTYALGPESFIFGGDSIFAGLDAEKFHIVIDPRRKQDYLDNKSWAPLEKYFVYKVSEPVTDYSEYGGRYAYVYENGSVQKVHKEMGHKIEHMFVALPDVSFLNDHSGALKLCNDIGEWNNFQLDAVGHSAFKGCQELRRVLFTDLYGSGMFGTAYTGFDVTLEDSCFAHCPNLRSMDLVYLVTDGTNHIDAITPQQLKVGRGVFADSPVRLKMMPSQRAWFEADTTWNTYRDRFLPCIIRPLDSGVKKALADFTFCDEASTGYDQDTWSDYIDLDRLPRREDGSYLFESLTLRIAEYNDDIYSFPDFRCFEALNMTTICDGLFKGCLNMNCIQLPSTTEVIGQQAFQGCKALTEIEIPAGVDSIASGAFADCTGFKSILVRSTMPPALGENVFHKHQGLDIYVPIESINRYLSDPHWREYLDYLRGTDRNHKIVKVKKPGQLAEELGLETVMTDYAYSTYSPQLYRLRGQFAQYDSLTVSGPLNGLDLGVIRYLAGSDVYKDNPTEGKLRYLNLWNADFVKDNVHAVNFSGFIKEFIDADNKVPDYWFEHCKSLETIILPKSVTYIGENVFDGASNLKKVAVGSNTTGYECDILENIEGIDELSLLTSSFATSEYSDPWEANIGAVYTTKSQIGNYLGDPNLTTRAMSMVAPFADDAVWTALTDHGHFFLSEIAKLPDAEEIFEGNTEIRTFDDFCMMQAVGSLESTFNGCSSLESISLGESVVSIGADAFAGCVKLDSIKIYNDSVPALAEHAFRDLPEDFVILVPKDKAKRYREAWAEYADHINTDLSLYSDDDIITVTVTEPNTLAAALGLQTAYDHHVSLTGNPRWFVCSLRGDYSHIRKLKVIGPISGADLSVLRYLSGFCAWTNSRNYAGRLEYIDLYDADLKSSRFEAASDTHWSARKPGFSSIDDDNVLPHYAFLQAYSLKTLILPKTCTEVYSRALQECESLETLVVGDSTRYFNWDAFDDDASLTRMYILSQKKLPFSSDFVIWSKLCNNYNPTFDAFYVRPSLYREYLQDPDYTGSSWQRTNNISKGVFDEDDSFCAFAAHAAATKDDLGGVTSVDGWFDAHTEAKNLMPLHYTSVDTFSRATFQPLTKLEQVGMPSTLTAMEKGLFADNDKLRVVEALTCDFTGIADCLHEKGLNYYGIDTRKTLVYMPKSYGESDGTNIVGFNGEQFHAQTYRMTGDKDYLVPYSFEADRVENSRALPANFAPYSICLPYRLTPPAGTRVYQLSRRDGSTLVFTQVNDELEALKPYIIKVDQQSGMRQSAATLGSDIAQTIPASGGATTGGWVQVPGLSFYGTLNAIDNAEAADRNFFVLGGDGNWHAVTASSDEHLVQPFTAYLVAGMFGGTFFTQLNEAEETPAPTAIDSLKTIDDDGTVHFYDLSGRELSGKPSKAVVIKNGKKVVVK